MIDTRLNREIRLKPALVGSYHTTLIVMITIKHLIAQYYHNNGTECLRNREMQRHTIDAGI